MSTPFIQSLSYPLISYCSPDRDLLSQPRRRTSVLSKPSPHIPQDYCWTLEVTLGSGGTGPHRKKSVSSSVRKRRSAPKLLVRLFRIHRRLYLLLKIFGSKVHEHRIKSHNKRVGQPIWINIDFVVLSLLNL